MTEVVRNFAAAVDATRIRANEAAIDDALFSLARIRSQLVGLDLNTAACRVDEAIEDIEAKCRAVFRKRSPELIARADARYLRDSAS